MNGIIGADRPARRVLPKREPLFWVPCGHVTCLLQPERTTSGGNIMLQTSGRRMEILLRYIRVSLRTPTSAVKYNICPHPVHGIPPTERHRLCIALAYFCTPHIVKVKTLRSESDMDRAPLLLPQLRVSSYFELCGALLAEEKDNLKR